MLRIGAALVEPQDSPLHLSVPLRRSYLQGGLNSAIQYMKVGFLANLSLIAQSAVVVFAEQTNPWMPSCLLYCSRPSCFKRAARLLITVLHRFLVVRYLPSVQVEVTYLSTKHHPFPAAPPSASVLW